MSLPIRFFLNVVFFCTFTLISCVSNEGGVLKPDMKPVDPIKNSRSEKKPERVSSVASKRDLLRYIIRLSSLDSPFSYEDESFLGSISVGRGDSFAEAAIVVGSVRKVLDSSRSVSESEDTELSLESILLEKNLNLEKALEKNVAIKNHSVYGLVLKSLEGSSDSDLFKERIRNLIYAEARMWASLMPGSSTLSGEAGDKSGYEIEVRDGVDQDSIDQDGAIISTADLRRGDNLLVQGQVLADQGEYKKAIDKIRSIREKDPLFGAAKEKIKDLSNLAVQRLRQKAAQAFQDAMPADDPSTKGNYLAQAKRYLEQALRDFPDSDQLETVSDNLVVISLDLEKLNEKKGSEVKD